MAKVIDKNNGQVFGFVNIRNSSKHCKMIVLWCQQDVQSHDKNLKYGEI